MNRNWLRLGIPVAVFVLCVLASFALVPVLYPETKSDSSRGVDHVAAARMDLERDDQRRNLFLGGVLVGAVAAVGTGAWMWRQARAAERKA